MIWEDFFIDRRLSPSVIATGVAKVFGVEVDSVFVVPELGPIDLPSGTRILVGAREVSGEFLMYISIIPQWRPVRVRDDIEVIARLCAEWGCRALVSSESPSPYLWLLVDDKASTCEVMLDADELDLRDRYVIRASAVRPES